MLTLIGAAIAAITEGLKLANTEASRKYIDQMVKLKMDILEEEDRGYDSDDAKIESLYKELTIVMQASQQELALYVAKK